MPDLPSWAGWLGFVAGIFASIALALGLALLIAPVSAIVAGMFLDDVAEVVEKSDYPLDPKGRPLPVLRSFVLSLKFLGVIILGNIIALLMLLIPGVNIIAFFVVNGYLLGREFFEFAAMRFRPEMEAKALRSKHATTVFLAGLVIAAFMAIPILNLLTPLFAAAMMVQFRRFFRRLADIGNDAGRAFGLAGLADIAAMQDQPVMGVIEIFRRNDLHQFGFHLIRCLARREAKLVADAEYMRVDGHRRLPESHAEHHIGGLAADTGKLDKLIAIIRHLAAIVADQ
eukprot:gene24148-28974_t